MSIIHILLMLHLKAKTFLYKGDVNNAYIMYWNLINWPLNFGSKVMYSLVPLSHVTVNPNSVSNTVNKCSSLIWNFPFMWTVDAPGSDDTTGVFSLSNVITVLLIITDTFFVHVNPLLPHGTFWTCIWNVSADEPLQESCARMYSQAPLKVYLFPSKVI